MKSFLGCAIALSTLIGCSTVKTSGEPDVSRSGQVGVRDITHGVTPTARMALAENENFQMPLAESGNVPPQYPTQLLAQRLPPQALCLRVSIDTDGTVMSSAPIVEAPDCAGTDAVSPGFFDAAMQAANTWRFDPGFRCVFPDDETKERSGLGCLGGEEVPQAVSLAYRFVFEQRDGRGSVRMSD